MLWQHLRNVDTLRGVHRCLFAVWGVEMQVLTTEKRMFSYVEMVEAWQTDHRDAKKVNKLEDVLRKADFSGMLCEGMLLWESITELHEAVLNSITIGEIEPNLDLEKKIWCLYQQWLRNTEQLYDMLNVSVSTGLIIEHADEFVACLEDAREQLSLFPEPTTAIESFVGFQA